MTITYRGAVSIGELVAYAPALLLGVFLAHRHGFRRSSAWANFLIVFSLVRIIGAECELNVTTSKHPSSGLVTTATLLTSIGISPLLLITVGLLSRVLQSIHRHVNTAICTVALRVIGVVISVALTLAIIGGVNTDFKPDDPSSVKVQTTSKIAVFLFIAALVAIFIVAIHALIHASQAERGEKRIIFAVLASLPFLGLRVLYSTLTALSHDKHFRLMNGSVTAFLVMSVLPEISVVVIYLIIGFTLKVLPTGGQPAYNQYNGFSRSTLPTRQKATGSTRQPFAAHTQYGNFTSDVEAAPHYPPHAQLSS